MKSLLVPFRECIPFKISPSLTTLIRFLSQKRALGSCAFVTAHHLNVIKYLHPLDILHEGPLHKWAKSRDQCSKLKPSYEFHFEGFWNFSIAIEGHI